MSISKRELNKLQKVINEYNKKQQSKKLTWKQLLAWEPRITWYASKKGSHPEGGHLSYYYSSDGEFWVDANNTKGYSFLKHDQLIMEI